jgi:class 3 adenylate cyclase/tetratricopeptide (TPR) repeat protein
MPDHVAARMEASAAALEGERKQVTVLFADVQGSMDLAESVDPETWRAIMDGCYGLICEEVHRFEGTVSRFTGDGAMALFGAPIADEDHAVRACYAALHLRDRLRDYASVIRREHGLGFSVRMGLNSGEVVVGSMGSDHDLEFTAIGNTVGLASRMEALAEPGKPCLTTATAALVDGYFELDDIGEVAVRGVSGPVHTYALLGVGTARTRLEVASRRGLSRFVGRDEEMAALEAALERAELDGQAVGVVAEPGLGKSRLCQEFAETCQRRGVNVTEGRGVAHGQRIPLLPVIEMMRGYFGIVEHDDARAAREKIAGRLLLLDESFRDALPVVFDFLGVPDPDNASPAQMTPEARQRALFSVVRRLVEARAGDGPGVIVVEDLHWLDPGSESFLENLVGSLPGSRTLVVANFRPEYHAEWMRASYYQQLPLLPLSPEAIGALVENLIGDDPSLDGVADLLAERTAGNPFFIEEVVQGLIESGALDGERGKYRLTRSIEEIAIPPTVQAVLAARIDRLADRDKSVLQSAAVIGREFSESVLRAVTGLAEHELAEALGELRGAEMIYEKTLYPEAEYAFKHPLTEEVAYRSQLRGRRVRVHRAVAEGIQELYPDRLDELSGLLATHWEQANEPLEAARWSARAAAWTGKHHPTDALRHWRRVQALLGDADSSDEARGLRLAACLWILQLGWRLGLDETEVETVFEEARGLAESSGDKSSMALVFLAHGIAVGMAGDHERALGLSRRSRALAAEAGNRAIELSTGPSYWLWTGGRLQEALAEAEDVLPRYEEDVAIGKEVLGFSPYIFLLMWTGTVLLPERGRVNEARQLRDRALGLAESHGDLELLGWIHSNWVNVALASGEPEDALDHARKGVDIAERLGSSFSRLAAYLTTATAHQAREEWAEARAWAERSLDLLETARTGVPYEAYLKSILAECALGTGDVAEARRLAEDAVATAVRRHTRGMEARARVVLGRSLTVSGVTEGARRELEEALGMTRACGLAMLETIVHEALAELAAAEGDRAGCEAELREALRMHREHGATGHERRLLSELEPSTPPV